MQEVGYEKVNRKPPLPFDISTLQSEAYKFFGYTPRFTLKISQQLYLDALISYPRTNSQKLPSIIDYKKIIHSFKNQSGYKRLASKLLKKQILRPREGAKEDSAHPAIYPTGNLPEKPLDSHEKKIFDLIIRRFMAVFGEDALMEKLKVHLEVNNYGFFIRGLRILKEGWIEYYKPYVRTKEVILPIIKEGDNFQLKHIIREDKFTSPPSRYNPSSLLKKMEKFGIGTKATRADIIQTLYDRGYIKEKQIMITELGFSVIEILGMYAAFVVSAQLTQEIEYKVERIKRSEIKRVTVLAEVIEQLKPQLERLKENEDFIGETLTKAIDKLQTKERVVGKCPTCTGGNLIIFYSRTTRKRFIGCTNYFKNACKTSFPLPQRGTVKPLHKSCKGCGWSTLLVKMKGRRPWTLCFNENCPKKEERRKRLEMQSLQQRSPK